MPVVKCPKCGEIFHSDELIPVQRLSPAARHILHRAPLTFLNGHIMPIQTLADLTGYSYSQTQYALRELAQAGYVHRIKRGSRKHVYCGVMTHA